MSMQQAGIETVIPKNGRAYTVIEVPSERNPAKKYRVDIVNQRCSCPAWIFQKGTRKPCKHLKALGFGEQTSVVETVNGVTYL